MSISFIDLKPEIPEKETFNLRRKSHMHFAWTEQLGTGIEPSTAGRHCYGAVLKKQPEAEAQHPLDGLAFGHTLGMSAKAARHGQPLGGAHGWCTCISMAAFWLMQASEWAAVGSLVF